MTFVIIYIYLSAVWNLTWRNCWRLAWQHLRVPQTELERVAGEEAWNCAKPAVTDENGWMDDSALVLKTKCVLHELMKIICFSSFQGFFLKNTIDVDFIVRLGNVSSPNINIWGYYFSSIIWFIQVCRGKKKSWVYSGDLGLLFFEMYLKSVFYYYNSFHVYTYTKRGGFLVHKIKNALSLGETGLD